MNEVNDVFSRAFNSCTKEIPFKKDWSNGTGYFDFAVYGEHAPKLANGELVRSISPGGRRLLIVGTRLGNLVVFDRFAEQAAGQKGDHNAVFVRNTTSIINEGGWFSESALDDYEMEIAVGAGDQINLGKRLEMLWSAFRKSAE